ncbi:MAG: outer membrane lipid asymmetry maintenance protein MlaD [Deltaproteobacteria bacterium]|nr:outer membrane lipid asymmetry maintenance protein MlaD [Deltaproteobacteria bacterium]
MRDVKTETAVGIFMMIGIACLAWLSIRLGNVEIGRGDKIPVEAEFSSVQGLKTGAAVEIAGVEIGTIESIAIRDYKAVVRMAIRKDIPLQEDAIASIRSRGLIGDKYISISPGASDRLIPAGGKIRETEPPMDFEKLIGQVIHGKAEGEGGAK